MVLSFCILLLFIFYASGGFRKLLKHFEIKPDPGPRQMQPGENINPDPPKVDREKLEKIARDCLTTSGVKFDTYYYTRFKSDNELMDIIKDYNLNK